MTPEDLINTAQMLAGAARQIGATNAQVERLCVGVLPDEREALEAYFYSIGKQTGSEAQPPLGLMRLCGVQVVTVPEL